MRIINTSRISLSRLAITGTVSSSTPLIVLIEIADAHSINYDNDKLNDSKYLANLLNTINITNVNTVREPYDMRDYKLIARFVNKNFQWKKRSLIEAFDLLLDYTNINNLSAVHTNFDFGPQTPDNPKKLNACVLYGICKANRIDTRPDSTRKSVV